MTDGRSVPVYTSTAEGFRSAEEIAALRPVLERNKTQPRARPRVYEVEGARLCACGCGRSWSAGEFFELADHIWQRMRPIVDKVAVDRQRRLERLRQRAREAGTPTLAEVRAQWASRRFGDEIVGLWTAGWSMHAIGDKLGISQSTVKNGLTRQGLKPERRPWRGGGPGPTYKPINHGTKNGYEAHRRRGESACGFCKEANRQSAAQYRLVAHKQRAINDRGRERAAEAVRLRAEGWSVDEVAEIIGVHRRTVYKYLKQRSA